MADEVGDGGLGVGGNGAIVLEAGGGGGNRVGKIVVHLVQGAVDEGHGLLAGNIALGVELAVGALRNAQLLGHADGLVGFLGVGVGALGHVGEVGGDGVILVLVLQEGAVEHQHKVAAGDVGSGSVLAVGALGNALIGEEVHGIGSPGVGGAHIRELSGLGLLLDIEHDGALVLVVAGSIVGVVVEGHFAVETGARHEDHIVQIELGAGGLGVELVRAEHFAALEHTGEVIEQLAGGGSERRERHIAESSIGIGLVGIGDVIGNGVGAVAKAHTIGGDSGGLLVEVNTNNTAGMFTGGAVGSEGNGHRCLGLHRSAGHIGDSIQIIVFAGAHIVGFKLHVVCHAAAILAGFEAAILGIGRVNVKGHVRQIAGKRTVITLCCCPEGLKVILIKGDRSIVVGAISNITSHIARGQIQNTRGNQAAIRCINIIGAVLGTTLRRRKIDISAQRGKALVVERADRIEHSAQFIRHGVRR